MEMEVETDAWMELGKPCNRCPIVDVDVEEEAAKKRKMEPDAEEQK
ncbi:hypothetical protein ACP70R_011567 [Stipagrostis hirtigluma subsp. patula]